MIPSRIQLRRTRGWRMPPDTTNVARPGRWGNQYRVREADGDPAYGIVIPAITRQQAVDMHRADLIQRLWKDQDYLVPLRGQSVGCWCDLEGPCHGDTYLEFAPLTGEALIKRLMECRSVAA